MDFIKKQIMKEAERQKSLRNMKNIQITEEQLKSFIREYCNGTYPFKTFV